MLPAGYEVDHILPLHLNGSDDSLNLQALCNDCHAEKSLMEAIGREKSMHLPPSVKFCAVCEQFYSLYFPHMWHWKSLKGPVVI